MSTSITRSTCVLAASRPTRILATDAYRPGGVRTSARAGIRTLNEVGGPSGSTGTTTSRQPRNARTISASREFSVDRASSSTCAMSASGSACLVSSRSARSSSVSSRSRSRRWASCSRLPRAAAPVGVPAGGGSSGPAGCGSIRASTAASSTCRSRVAWPASAEPRRCSRTTSVSASAADSCRLTSVCGTSAIRAPAAVGDVDADRHVGLRFRADSPGQREQRQPERSVQGAQRLVRDVAGVDVDDHLALHRGDPGHVDPLGRTAHPAVVRHQVEQLAAEPRVGLEPRLDEPELLQRHVEQLAEQLPPERARFVPHARILA